jgi:hypothetical protein
MAWRSQNDRKVRGIANCLLSLTFGFLNLFDPLDHGLQIKTETVAKNISYKDKEIYG